MKQSSNGSISSDVIVATPNPYHTLEIFIVEMCARRKQKRNHIVSARHLILDSISENVSFHSGSSLWNCPFNSSNWLSSSCTPSLSTLSCGRTSDKQKQLGFPLDNYISLDIGRLPPTTRGPPGQRGRAPQQQQQQQQQQNQPQSQSPQQSEPQPRPRVTERERERETQRVTERARERQREGKRERERESEKTEN